MKNASGDICAGPFVAYGKADNRKAADNGNRDRDPVLPWGDTPDGDYVVSKVVKTGTGTEFCERSYGPEAAIAIEPVAGDALRAKLNGRFGLYIHSGHLNVEGRLRPTFGCIRLSDPDMGILLDALRGQIGADLDAACAEPDPILVRVGAFGDSAAT